MANEPQKIGDIGIKNNYANIRVIYFHADAGTAKMLEQYGDVKPVQDNDKEKNLYKMRTDSRYKHEDVVAFMRSYKKPAAERPERKADFLVNWVGDNCFEFFGDSKHVRHFMSFGKVWENSGSYYCRVDKRYDFNEVIAYAKSLESLSAFDDMAFSPE